MAEKKNNSSGNVLQNISLIAQFGIFMLVPIGGMSVGGYFLDKYFGTSWIFIVCFFVGAVAGGQNVYRLAMKVARKKHDAPEENIINRRQDSETKSEKSND